MNFKDRSMEIGHHIVINIDKQTLALFKASKSADLENQQDELLELHLLKVFDVSTAKNGIGNLESTGCTPLGKHVIAEKIGANAPINSVFVGRVATGEIYNDRLGTLNPERDWILSRILWLAGTEEGINKGNNQLGCCDTYKRYIYIHGTPDTEPMGLPMSHGCIRMRNTDVIWLFDNVKIGTSVEIIAK